MRLALLLCLLLIGCSGPAYAGKQYTHRIEMEGSVCSATAVGPKSLLTADHCIPEGLTGLSVDGRKAQVVHVERDGQDHIILKLSISFKAWTPITVDPPQGARIRWWGNPAGIPDVYGEGTVAGRYGDYILFDGNIWKGCSGAGLFDNRGRLVGVVSGMLYRQDYKINWALPLKFTKGQIEVATR